MARPPQPIAVSPVEECAYTIKVVVVGDSGVGKSCILKNFARGKYDEQYVSTIGVDFETKIVQVLGQRVKLYLWDTAGQERFRNITRSYYRSAAAILLVYDVSDRESFVNVSKWHEDVLESLSVEEAYFVLIGNKADLPESERKITFEEGKELADSKNMIFIETSARTSANIQELFSRVAEEFIIRSRRIQNDVEPSGNVQISSEQKDEPDCC